MSNFPSFKIILFPKLLKDNRQSVMLRVTYLRKSKYYSLNRKAFSHEWNEEQSRFKKTYIDSAKHNDMLRTYEQRASDAIRNMERDKVPFSWALFEQEVFGAGSETNNDVAASAWVKKLADEFYTAGKHGTSESYAYVSRNIARFNANTRLRDVDGAWLRKYEAWMRSEGMEDGGIGVVLRTFRAACNRAVRDKLLPASWYPFQDYSISHIEKKKAKKAATLSDIRAFESLSLDHPLRQYVDVFLLSFYLRGANLADIAMLTADNIKSGRIQYTRAKTGKVYSIAISPKVQDILSRTRYENTLVLLWPPVKNITTQQVRNRIKRYAKRCNSALRDAAEELGLNIDRLTFYTARHTYATSLKLAGVSLEIISEALGHSDIRTTDTYLKAFDMSVLDAADQIINN